jgi:hypothetical protein
MPKYSLYLPDDLLSAMREFKGTPVDPNWSAVAQEAFRLEVQRLKNRKEGASKMQAAIERLRASKQRHANQDYTHGHSAGIKWATERAEYPELVRAAEYVSENTFDDEADSRFHHMVAGGFYAAIMDLRMEGREHIRMSSAEGADVQQFWLEQGLENPTTAFVHGFADGAKEVFDEVEAKLQ